MRQATVKLPCFYSDLKHVSNKPRRSSQHGITIMNTRRNESMYKCRCGLSVKRSLKTSNGASRNMLSIYQIHASHWWGQKMWLQAQSTWSLTVIVSVLRSSDGPLLPRTARPYLDPTQRSSCLIGSKLEPIYFHPALHVCDTHFKSLRSHDCCLQLTLKVQLRVINIRVVLDIMCWDCVCEVHHV